MTSEAIPGKYAPPPVPCDTALLIAWLNKHWDFAIPPDATFHRCKDSPRAGIVGHVQDRYGAIPAREPLKGLFPSDAWWLVLETEKRIQGGQTALF